MKQLGCIISIVLSLSAAAQVQPCIGNLLQNGTLASGLQIVGNGSMPASIVDKWSPASRDPQLVSAGACDPLLASTGACGTAGFVAMWGNQAIGEAIQQTLTQPLKQGQKYRFSACLRYANPSSAGPVRLRVRASSGPLPNYSSRER